MIPCDGQRTHTHVRCTPNIENDTVCLTCHCLCSVYIQTTAITYKHFYSSATGWVSEIQCTNYIRPREERRSNHYMFWQIHFADKPNSHKRGRVEKLILYCIDFRGKFLFTFDRTKYRILMLAHNNTFIRVTIVSCNALQQYMNCVY